jgi:hypothetical protein
MVPSSGGALQGTIRLGVEVDGVIVPSLSYGRGPLAVETRRLLSCLAGNASTASLGLRLSPVAVLLVSAIDAVTGQDVEFAANATYNLDPLPSCGTTTNGLAGFNNRRQLRLARELQGSDITATLLLTFDLPSAMPYVSSALATAVCQGATSASLAAPVLQQLQTLGAGILSLLPLCGSSAVPAGGYGVDFCVSAALSAPNTQITPHIFAPRGFNASALPVALVCAPASPVTGDDAVAPAASTPASLDEGVAGGVAGGVVALAAVAGLAFYVIRFEERRRKLLNDGGRRRVGANKDEEGVRGVNNPLTSAAAAGHAGSRSLTTGGGREPGGGSSSLTSRGAGGGASDGMKAEEPPTSPTARAPRQSLLSLTGPPPLTEASSATGLVGVSRPPVDRQAFVGQAVRGSSRAVY